VLSGNSAAPSPSCYDDSYEDAVNTISATSIPNVSDTPVAVENDLALLLASSETPIVWSPSRSRESSSAVFEGTERSQASTQSPPGITEDLTAEEGAIFLATAHDAVDLLSVYCEDPDQFESHLPTRPNHEGETTQSEELERVGGLISGQGRNESVPPHDGTDKSLKQAISGSYTKFGLETHLIFRYGSGSFSHSTIDLSTNWKSRSVLNQTSWKSLNAASQRILSFLPAFAKNKQLQKEKGLVQRIMQGARPKVEEGSLKAIAVELHRERNHAKDESLLANFEFYSTLIIMRHFDKVEVSAERTIDE